MDAVILAGGKGTRLGCETAKAMVMLKEKPLISYQINYLLKSKQVEKIILCLGQYAKDVIDYIKKTYPDENIVFSVEDEPLGTGGAFKKGMKLSQTEFVLAQNCDDITDIDIDALQSTKENTVCVAHPRLLFGKVVEKAGYAEFVEKPMLDIWVSCGWYLLKREELLKLLPDKGSIEYDVFPNIKLRVFKHEGFWMTVNTKKDIAEFEKAVLPEVLR